MDITNTRQNNNIVYGDQAGGHLTKNYVYDVSEPTQMRHLIDRLKQEREGDAKFTETLEILMRYIMPPTGETVDGLETKLRVAGQDCLFDFASRTKEYFSKKLFENQFSLAGQEILAFLLAEIYTRFQKHVVPAIQMGQPIEVVNRLVQSHVIDDVQRLLGENPLRLYSEEVNGMLYYLTGNCHIKWAY